MKCLYTTFCRLSPALVLALALGACSTTAPRPETLDKARSAVDHAQSTPEVERYARTELDDAVNTYRRAESLFRKEGDTAEMRKLALQARQRAAAARELAEQREAAQKTALVAKGREPTELGARAAEADAAHDDAQRAKPPGGPVPGTQTPVQTQTPAQADAARRKTILLQQVAQYARQQARDGRPRNEWIESELRDFHATKSDRGLVITMSDVLFDAGSADLRPGGIRLVARIAAFLHEYPNRTIAIEGFTDSVGDEALNRTLSERRADAVRAALMDGGIQGNRIVARGYGEAFPVASNETAEGRQRNRRVEVVIGSGTEVAPRVASSAPAATGSPR